MALQTNRQRWDSDRGKLTLPTEPPERETAGRHAVHLLEFIPCRMLIKGGGKSYFNYLPRHSSSDIHVTVTLPLSCLMPLLILQTFPQVRSVARGQTRSAAVFFSGSTPGVHAKFPSNWRLAAGKSWKAMKRNPHTLVHTTWDCASRYVVIPRALLHEVLGLFSLHFGTIRLDVLRRSNGKLLCS